MKDTPDTSPEKSAEYQNFEALLKRVATVPKAESDRSIQAEKDAKKQKQSARGAR